MDAQSVEPSRASLREKNTRLKETYTTQGLKLLQHTDVLYEMQHSRRFRPIQVQLAPTEACESDCPFCSVAHRPVRAYIPIDVIQRCIVDFARLGAKSIEITGGGNPLLYRDQESGADINQIINMASANGLDVGIITNSHTLKKIDPGCFDAIRWIRLSLIKLDEGKKPEDFDFCGFPTTRIGMSYIYYERPSYGKHHRRYYTGNFADTMNKITRLYQLYPDIKFVRIAPDASIGSLAASQLAEDTAIQEMAAVLPKAFIQDTEYFGTCSVFEGGCYVGALRPYVASSPDNDGEAYAYICACHTHFCGNTYDKRFALCNVADIIPTWNKMAANFKDRGYPYEIDGNMGKNWTRTCASCYYAENNKLLHAVAHPVEDANFA